MTGVAELDGDAGADVEGVADLVLGVELGTVEAVDRDDKRDATGFEEVEGPEAVGDAPGVGEDDRAEGASRQFLPHEPEPVLARCAEEVQHHLGTDRDPAEVQRHRGCRLADDPGDVVDGRSDLGQPFFRA